ncbi:ATP-binding protein [Saccharothrix algeriensis]|uniref:ATP-binding protein n=1 Tax=Saccharothrix algeriensis TaxID=173560 RepID=A0A8T8HZF0_9PSEU|nr:ATP-binding protein [Saccharothrix algeriensis]
MNAQTEQVDDLRLVALPTAVTVADMFVRFSLAEWRLRSMQDEAAQTARRLVGAAVEVAEPGVPGFLLVRLRLSGAHLVVEVEGDRVALPPELAMGRAGLVDLTAGGRLAWCELTLPSGMNASAVPLPRREPRRSPAAERLGDEPEVDPELIQRILYGLGGAAGRRAD